MIRKLHINEQEKDDNHGSRFDWTGAVPILDTKLMLAASRKILRRTLIYIYDIAVREAKSEFSQPDDVYERRQKEHRPHQVFLLDGARGSGKTTLLLTIQRYLELLGAPEKWVVSEVDPLKPAVDFLNEKAGDIRNEIESEIGKTYTTGYFKDPMVLKQSKRRVALVLPVLYPSDLEFSQTIMEGIIALMSEKLESDLKDLDKKAGDDASERRENAKVLKDELSQSIAAGWFLSNNVGMDAVLRDSADYRHFLVDRTEANRLSFARVTHWRNFVNKFLDHFDSELLAVFFDDTDLGISITKDILHTIRIFLDHPRIVTVIAGNLRSIRQSLLLEEMKSLRGPMRSLAREGEHTANDWRRFARQQIEESLEKVLPRQFRMSIAPVGTGSAEDDFRSMFRGHSLDEFCGNRLNLYRDDFIVAKHEAHFRWLEDLQERAPGQNADLNILENYTAWWVFRHGYHEELRPRSARHMAALRAFTVINKGSDSAADLLPSEHRKRLAVILFESPDNFEIIHRLNDFDVRISEWLKRQKVESCWRGNRCVSINGQSISERAYSYQALFFRIDLDLALPIHENRGVTIHPGLLPEAAGHNLLAYRPFFERNTAQPLFGAADAIKSSLIPANCFYLSDLSSLPDIAWKDAKETSDPWGHRLIYGWPKYFFFYNNAGREDGREQEFSMSPHKVPEAWIKDYFVNIVIPMAGVSMGKYVRPPLDLQRKRPLSEIADDSLLAAEMRERPNKQRPGEMERFFEGHVRQIETIIRHFDYLESVATGPSGSVTIQHKADDVLDIWEEYIMGPAFPERRWNSARRDEKARQPAEGKQIEQHEEEKQILAEYIASYQWLANDVRRAWHAARIFINQTSDTLKKASSRSVDKTANADMMEVTYKDTFARSDLYVIGSRVAFDRWLTRSPTMKNYLKPIEECANKARQDYTSACASTGGGATEFAARLLSKTFGVKLDGDFYVPDDSNHSRHVLEDLDAIIDYSGLTRGDRKIVPRLEESSGKDKNSAPSVKRDGFVITGDELSAILGSHVQPGKGRNEFEKWPFERLKLDPGMFIDEKYELPDLEKLKDENEEEYERAKKLNASVSRVRSHFRISRSLLLFLYGVAPCLPSLIHIEIASIMKAHYDKMPPIKPSAGGEIDDSKKRTEDQKRVEEEGVKYALGALKDWELRIWSYLHFVREYRRVLEFTKIRLDVMTLRREVAREWRNKSQHNMTRKSFEAAVAQEKEVLENISPSKYGVRLSMIPDISYDLLGVNGLIGLPIKFDASVEDYDLLTQKLETLKKSYQNHNNRSNWRSIFEDVVSKLAEAQNFISATRQTLSRGTSSASL